jgi:hypothetical protein
MKKALMILWNPSHFLIPTETFNNYCQSNIPPFESIYVSSVLAAASYFDPNGFYGALKSYSKTCTDEELKKTLFKQGQFTDVEFLKSSFKVARSEPTQAYAWMNEEKVYIVFRGTGLNPFVLAENKDLNLLIDGIKDAFTDLKVILKSPLKERKDVMIHTGFWNQFEAVRVQLEEVLDAAEAKFKRNYEVIICGHSLGAALAAVATAYFSHQQRRFPNGRFISHTFGCPRVGNKAFSDYYNEYVSEHWRICNYSDPVPMVPLKSTNTYSHIVGNTVSLYSNFTVNGDFQFNFYINDMLNFQFILVLLSVFRLLFFSRVVLIMMQHDPDLYCKRLYGFIQNNNR